MRNTIFIHGLESSGRGFKGSLLRKIFPEILTPDFEPNSSNFSFKSLLEKRMLQLEAILNDKENWIIIASSFGGLMGTLYTLNHSKKVKVLILLAPFFGASLLNPTTYQQVDVPIVVFHGKNDSTASIEQSKLITNMLFSNLEYNSVDDDHFLHITVQKINWIKLIEKYK